MSHKRKGYSPVLDTFITRDDDWSSKLVQPPSMEGHSCVSWKDRMIVFGGTNRTLMFSDIWLFSTESRRWRKVRTTGSIPLGRHSHSATICDGKMYIFGGFGLGGITNNSQIQSHEPGLPSPKQLGHNTGLPEQLTKPQDVQKPDSSKGRKPMQVELLDITKPSAWHKDDDTYQMIKCGVLNSMFCLNLASNDWTEIKPPVGGSHIQNHSSVIYKSRIYYFGGSVLGGKTNQVRAFCCKTGKWLPTSATNPEQVDNNSMGEHTPTVRSGHTSVSWKKLMVVFGGRLNKTSLSDRIFRYNFETGQWAPVNNQTQITPPARYNHSAIQWNGNMIIIGGCCLTDPSSHHEPSVLGSSESKSRPGSAAPIKDSHAKIILDDCFCFNLYTQEWRQVSLTQSVPRMRHTAVCTSECTSSQSEVSQIISIFGGASLISTRRGVTEEQQTNSLTVIEFAKKRVRRTQKTIQPTAVSRLPSPPRQSGDVIRLVPTRPSTRNQTPSPHVSPQSRPNSARGPWIVKTSKATTAREFGSVFNEDYNQIKPTVVKLQDLNSIISRLANANRERLKMQILYEKYVTNLTDTREMTKNEQKESIKRLYVQATAASQKQQKVLRDRYLKSTRQRCRVPQALIEDMVTRLHRVPKRKFPEMPSYPKSSPEQAAETVNRLFYDGVKNSSDVKSILADRYCPQKTGPTKSQQQINDMVLRLYSHEQPFLKASGATQVA